MEHTNAQHEDTVAQQRFNYGLSLAYRLFNVMDLLGSAVRAYRKRGHRHEIDEKGVDNQSTFISSAQSAESYYVARVAALKRLSPEEELQLARKMRDGDELSKARLVVANLGLVVMFAKKYSRTGAPMIDLVAEGNIAMLKATDTFDPERGFRFSTYAKRPVTQAMVRALPRLTGSVTLPLQKQASGVESEDAQCFKRGGTDTSETGPFSSKTDYDAWSNQGPVPEATDMPADEEYEPANQIGDLLRDQTLMRAMDCLKAREREIVAARFGLSAPEPETLASLAGRFQISIERVRQIESAGLRRLAEHFAQAGHSLDTML